MAFRRQFAARRWLYWTAFVVIVGGCFAYDMMQRSAMQSDREANDAQIRKVMDEGYKSLKK